jgi:hypothetical protein
MFMNKKNTLCLAGCINPPVVVLDMSKVGKDQEEACKKLDEQEVCDDPKKCKTSHREASERAGMRHDDYQSLQETVETQDVCASFRATNKNSTQHIGAGTHQCKPLSVKDKTNPATGLTDTKPAYCGDYDMHDLIDNKTGKSVAEGSKRQKKIIDSMNGGMENGKKSPRVMHGPQATFDQYCDKNPAFVQDLKNKGDWDGAQESLCRPDKKLSVAEPVTVFDGSQDPSRVYQLETNEDVANLYRCKGAEMPEGWDLQDKSGNAVK